MSLWLKIRLPSRNLMLLSLGFVRNEVAGEEFDHALCGSHHGRHVKADVDRARQQPLLLDLVARQAHSKE